MPTQLPHSDAADREGMSVTVTDPQATPGAKAGVTPGAIPDSGAGANSGADVAGPIDRRGFRAWPRSEQLGYLSLIHI